MTRDRGPERALSEALAVVYTQPGRTSSIGTGQFSRLVLDALTTAGYRVTRTQANRQRTDRNLLRPQAAADLAGVNVRTLVRWTQRGILTTTHTPGGHHRYHRDEIEHWLAASTTHQTLPPPRDPGLPDPHIAALIDGDPTNDSTCPTCGQALP